MANTTSVRRATRNSGSTRDQTRCRSRTSSPAASARSNRRGCAPVDFRHPAHMQWKPKGAMPKIDSRVKIGSAGDGGADQEPRYASFSTSASPAFTSRLRRGRANARPSPSNLPDRSSRSPIPDRIRGAVSMRSEILRGSRHPATRDRPRPPAAGREHRQGSAGDAQLRADRPAAGVPARRLAEPRCRACRIGRGCSVIRECHGFLRASPTPLPIARMSMPRRCASAASTKPVVDRRSRLRSPSAAAPERSAILFGPERAGTGDRGRGPCPQRS